MRKLKININKVAKIDEIDFVEKLYHVYKAIKIVNSETSLNNKKTIGFVGAPWTLLVYMINKVSPKNGLSQDFFKDKILINEILNLLDPFNSSDAEQDLDEDGWDFNRNGSIELSK